MNFQRLICSQIVESLTGKQLTIQPSPKGHQFCPPPSRQNRRAQASSNRVSKVILQSNTVFTWRDGTAKKSASNSFPPLIQQAITGLDVVMCRAQ
jgi:hypothetical protein